jgi:hypothetical protein
MRVHYDRLDCRSRRREINVQPTTRNKMTESVMSFAILHVILDTTSSERRAGNAEGGRRKDNKSRTHDVTTLFVE